MAGRNTAGDVTPSNSMMPAVLQQQVTGTAASGMLTSKHQSVCRQHSTLDVQGAVTVRMVASNRREDQGQHWRERGSVCQGGGVEGV